MLKGKDVKLEVHEAITFHQIGDVYGTKTSVKPWGKHPSRTSPEAELDLHIAE